ncbi:MAG: hypothetical protein JNM90_02275 [Burkholderiales bacterium]|nr:hypothetical protein [Burkholderiales bacterium]
MREIAATRVRYGDWRIHILLRREGRQASKSLVYRLYREEGQVLRAPSAPRRKMAVQRQERFKPTEANQVWSLDFVAD